MATDVMGGSFLATLESEDGVKLGFSRVVKGGDGQLKAEPQDYLYASTLMDKSLVVEFRYVRPEVYALSCWGLLDSASSLGNEIQETLLQGDEILEPFPQGDEKEPSRPEEWHPAPVGEVPLTAVLSDGPPLVVHITPGSVPEKFVVSIPEASPEKVADMGPDLDSGPEQLKPWFKKSSEALGIGVDANGCVVKTKNKQNALNVRIENASPEFVHLGSSTTERYLTITTPGYVDDKHWCARVSDGDGSKARLKLRVIGVYAPDGEIQFT
ncbi:hypothetical protein IFT47_04035 [Pseudomonas sp. CFBP 13711]|uniref:hypothetical protein n=1 Tax=unclassified Pseudomonas TaxID=196821 RepID=UPI0017868ECA|nr:MULTISPECIES: hypothetical protein [unclassified Pseudomonas]MBD8705799.1 hypothetical protein [Pseudomonas sp. CFBP 13711]MBD8710502.1 hypothetical protein [Pseudomonas sp. CFBP 13715]